MECVVFETHWHAGKHHRHLATVTLCVRNPLFMMTRKCSGLSKLCTPAKGWSKMALVVAQGQLSSNARAVVRLRRILYRLHGDGELYPFSPLKSLNSN